MNIIEVEKSLIGAIIFNSDKMADVFNFVSIRDFASETAMVAYGAMLSLWKDQQPIEIESISQKIGADTNKIKWLSDATDVGSQAMAVHNAKLIANEARKRRLAAGLTTIVKESKLSDSNEMLTDILRIYNSEIIQTAKDPSAKEVIRRFDDSVKINKKRGFVGIPTGLSFFEKKYIEYVPGHLWVIGAYTSTGKTALMVELLSRVYAYRNPIVDIISTEMTEAQLTARMISNKSGLGTHAIWSGGLVSKHQEIADGWKVFFAEKNYRLYDTLKTIDQVQNAVRQRYLQGGIDIVFIDFIQNLRRADSKNSYEEKANIAIDLQNLAKDCKCTIICLSQITANVHKGNAGIVEYKGAGEIAEACDIGLWLSRDKTDSRNILLEIRKNRHGILGKQVMRFDEYYTSMQEHDDIENS